MYAFLLTIVANILDKDPAYVTLDEVKSFLRTMSNETRLFLATKAEGK